MGVDLYGDASVMAPERLTKVVSWVLDQVEPGVVESVFLKEGSHIVLDLKSNVQRVVSWPRGF
jgi:hypothetical protein